MNAFVHGFKSMGLRLHGDQVDAPWTHEGLGRSRGHVQKLMSLGVCTHEMKPSSCDQRISDHLLIILPRRI